MPQFRVLESSGGITVDALVTVDANSHQFSPAEQAQVCELDNPRSVSGSKLRCCVRNALTDLCDNVGQEISSVEFNATLEQEASQRRIEQFAVEQARKETKAALADQIAEEKALAEQAIAAAKIEGAASRDDEVTKLSETVLALQKELRQIKADAEFQQAADEARRVAQNQARRARCAKAAAAAKAKPTSKRK